MIIHQVQPSQSTGLSLGTSQSDMPSEQPSISDSSWFQAALEPQKTTQAPVGNVAERIVSQLSGSSEHIHQLSDKADRALSKAAVSSDPKDVMKASQALSSFYLESLLTTRLISKATQAIEKITNIQ